MNNAKNSRGLTWLEQIADKIKHCNREDNLSVRSLLDSFTLIDVFWILRLKYVDTATDEDTNIGIFHSESIEELEKLQTLIMKRNTVISGFKDILPFLKEIKEHIGKRFVPLIEKDYKHFIAVFMDSLYANSSAISDELKNIIEKNTIQDTENQNEDFFSIFQHTLDIVKEIQNNISNQEDCIVALLRALDVNPSSVQDFRLSAIPRTLEALSQPRYSKIYRERFFFDKNNKKKLHTIAEEHIPSLRASIQHLVEYEDAVYRSARKVCNVLESKAPLLEKFIIQLEYMTTSQFNLEIMLLFMFLDEFPSSADPIRLIIKKHENFFRNILSELKNNSQEINVNVLLGLPTNREFEGVSERYVYTGSPKEHELSTDIMFFRLKKILALFKFYNAVGNHSVSSEIVSAYKLYDFVLAETKLPDVSFNYVLDYLPEYLINMLGINKSNLASLLDITPKTVSETIANGTILKNYRWFWQAVTGYSYTYLSGETTIPSYGSMEAVKDIEYRKNYIATKAYAEIIIRRLLDLVTYEKSLAASSKVKRMQRKKYVLSAPYLQFISQKAAELATDIMRKRNDIERLLEKKRTIQIQIANDEKDLKNNTYIRNLHRTKKEEEYDKMAWKRLNDRIVKAMNSHCAEIDEINQKIEKELTGIARRLKGKELSESENEEIKSIMQNQEKYEIQPNGVVK